MATRAVRVDHRDVSTCSVTVLLVWWYHCLQVLWSGQEQSTSLCVWEPYEDYPPPPLQAMLAVLAVHRIAVLPIAWTELHPVVLQVGFQPVAVPAGVVCLEVLLGGLAVLLVFVDQHTLAVSLVVVLGGG